jgi:hypothetical protein
VPINPNKDVYRGRRKHRTLVTVIVSIVALLIIAAVTLFYSLQKYIVYDKDGLSLELPFLATQSPDSPDDTADPDVRPTSNVVAEIVVESPDFSDIVADAGENLGPLRALYVSQEEIGAGDLPAYAASLESRNAGALVLEMKPASGQLTWASAVDITVSYGTNGVNDLTESIASLKEQGVYLVAQLSCFADELMATRNTPVSLKNPDGTVYMDSDGICWLDPYNREVRQYVIDLAAELAAMGFDEILLTGLRHPAQTEGLVYSQEMTVAVDPRSCISNNAVGITEALAGTDVHVSALYDMNDARNGTSDSATQDATLFFKVFDRLYFYSVSEYYAFDCAFLEERLENGDASLRLVPIMPSSPDRTSWVTD